MIMPHATVKLNEVAPEPLELVAASIVKVADGIDKMRKSGLTKRAIVVLLHDATRVPMMHIESIIDAGPRLRQLMLVPEPKK